MTIDKVKTQVDALNVMNERWGHLGLPIAEVHVLGDEHRERSHNPYHVGLIIDGAARLFGVGETWSEAVEDADVHAHIHEGTFA